MTGIKRNGIAVITILSIFTYKDPKTIHTHYSSKNETDSIPFWVMKLYEISDTSESHYRDKKVIYFKRLTDSTSYAIVEEYTGTGASTFVATQKRRKDFKNMDIAQEMDSESSDPTYRIITYLHDSLHANIFVTIDDEIAKSKFTVKRNGVLTFKNGFDMDNAETYHLIKKQTLKVLRSGEIKIIELNTHIE
ncbi:MAG TPA: hypothetical protein VGG71_00365 [Chitinophagaceae bacterium]|jgi:hypothetical protein